MSFARRFRRLHPVVESKNPVALDKEAIRQRGILQDRMRRVLKKYPMIADKIEDAIMSENGSSITGSIPSDRPRDVLERSGNERRLVNDPLFALAYEERRVKERRSPREA